MRERLGNAAQALILGSHAEAAAPSALARREYRADLRGAARRGAGRARARSRPRCSRRAPRSARPATRPASPWRARAGLDGALRARRYRLALAATAARRRRRARRAGCSCASSARRPAQPRRAPTRRSRNVQLAARRTSPAAAAAGAARRPARHLPVAPARRARARSRLARRRPPGQRRAAGRARAGLLARARARRTARSAEPRREAAVDRRSRRARDGRGARGRGGRRPRSSRRSRERLDALPRRAALGATSSAAAPARCARSCRSCSVEYGRGVANGRVLRDFEIQEAITFQDGALSAFRDLEPMLLQRDAAATRAHREPRSSSSAATWRTPRAASGSPTRTSLEAHAKAIIDATDDALPEGLAEARRAAPTSTSSRARSTACRRPPRPASTARRRAGAHRGLRVLRVRARAAPARPRARASSQRVEGLFWYGADGHDGLATLINSRGAPDRDRGDAERARHARCARPRRPIGAGPKSRTTSITNTADHRLPRGPRGGPDPGRADGQHDGAQRRLRRPMSLGVGAALVASARHLGRRADDPRPSLTRYGEKLSAVVSLVAIGVLLLILNWFFHKVYWTGASGGSAREEAAMLATGGGRPRRAAGRRSRSLGFTSVYREGFETVLFLQALVLETGVATVLTGVLARPGRDRAGRRSRSSGSSASCRTRTC